MLRTNTQFFDPSLSHIKHPNVWLLEHAHVLSHKLTRLAQLISVKVLVPPRDNTSLIDFKKGLQDFFKEKGCNLDQETAERFCTASREAYRLQSLFKYPLKDDHPDAPQHRHLTLTLKFFKKNERESFFTMDFIFDYNGMSIA